VKYVLWKVSPANALQALIYVVSHHRADSETVETGCSKTGGQLFDGCKSNLQEAVEEVSKNHDQLDLLINAAGILHTADMSPGRPSMVSH